MTKMRKVLASTLVVGAAGGLSTMGAFSAFSSTQSNPNNRIQAGSVTLTDNQPATKVALYDQTALKQGETVTACYTLTYQGSLPGTVKFYVPDTIGALGPYVNLKIERGTGSAAFAANQLNNTNCTGFTVGSTVLDTTLNTLASKTYATGTSLPGPGGSTWAQTNSVPMRITATLSATTPDTAQGATTGLHSLTFEAQS